MFCKSSVRRPRVRSKRLKSSNLLIQMSDRQVISMCHLVMCILCSGSTQSTGCASQCRNSHNTQQSIECVHIKRIFYRMHLVQQCQKLLSRGTIHVYACISTEKNTNTQMSYSFSNTCMRGLVSAPSLFLYFFGNTARCALPWSISAFQICWRFEVSP